MIIRNITRFIKNIWKFKKELWEYRPWDHFYIEQMAGAMYEDIGRHISENDHFVNSNKVSRRAFVIAHLYKNYKYDSPYLMKLVEEWWSTKTEKELPSGIIEMHFKRNETQDRRIKKAREHTDAITEQRFDLLLTYIKKYHRHIWD